MSDQQGGVTGSCNSEDITYVGGWAHEEAGNQRPNGVYPTERPQNTADTPTYDGETPSPSGSDIDDPSASTVNGVVTATDRRNSQLYEGAEAESWTSNSGAVTNGFPHTSTSGASEYDEATAEPEEPPTTESQYEEDDTGQDAPEEDEDMYDEDHM